MSWTPDPAIIPFMDVHEDEKWMSPLICMSSDSTEDDTESGDSSVGSMSPVPEWYAAEFVGEVMKSVQVIADESGVILKVEEPTATVFPSVDIEYQIPGGDVPPYRITKHCRNFAELPGNVDEMIRYIPCPTNTKDFTVRITAHMLGGSVETADYVIRVWANYSIGKASLLEAINASRSQKR